MLINHLRICGKWHSWTPLSNMVQNIQNEGMVQALAGGEIEGEIVSLGEFLDKMKLE